jgi:PIN domain nuclease of toxin-antitoxin system
MRVLFDTHAFLWWIEDDLRLSSTVKEIIGDRSNELFFSAASGWEIAIKAKTGKLSISDIPEKFVMEQLAINAVTILPIQISHALHIYNLPNHHRDPFDRILIAQSQLENLPIMTVDAQIARYSVETIG